jgi:dimethylargininase
LRYAIMRRVSPALASCELTFLGRTQIDPQRADRQHREIGHRLESAGLTVITLPADPDLPDSTFTEDTAIVLDEIAIITNPGAAIRQAETGAIASILEHFRPLRWIKAPGTIEGGDVVRVDRTLYVGVGTRTNQAGLAQLTAIVAPFGYAVLPVQLSAVLHLKTAATWLGDGTWLINPAWIDPLPLRRFRLLPVPADEPWAANTLLLNGLLHLPVGFPLTSELLSANGYAVSCVEMDELQKAEAGLTCLSVIFEA